MLIAGLAVIAALAFVLGLGALCLYGIKRWGSGMLGARNRIPLEVVQRVSLGPKTGLAVVRVGEKVMAVSVGDGGVRTLFELDETDRRRIIETSTVPIAHQSSREAGEVLAAFNGKHAAAGSFADMFKRTVSDSLPNSDSGAININRSTVSAEVPGFLIAPQTGAKTALNTYGPPASFQQRDGSSSQNLQNPQNLQSFGNLLSVSLSNATRLASIALISLVVGASSLHAAPAAVEQQTTTAQPPTPPPAPAAPSVQGGRPASTARTAAANAPTAGTQPAQPRSQMQLPPSQPVSGRAQQASPAPVAADEAMLRLMPQVDMQLGGNGTDGGLRLNGTVGVVVMMGLLTLLPTLLLMMTGFTRILVVLHFLKQAMGTQSAPPSHLLAGMALLLTGFVMGPTLAEANRTAVTPWLNGEITQVEMMKTGVQPFREFMLRQTRTSDVETFVRLSRIQAPDTIDDVPLHVLMSAFVASELRTAFQIGFAIYLPFIIIDAVVASVLMSMGMFMLPPAMISLPFKLLLFVLVDGWNLTITSLVQSFR